jgi:hypothetical protein
MNISDWPETAAAVVSNRADGWKLRLFASEASVLDVYLIFLAFSSTGRELCLVKEAQEQEIIEISSSSDLTGFEQFFDAVFNKNLNALLANGERGSVFFDWDDRYFLAVGNSEFLSICHPMPLHVGKMYFESRIPDDVDEKMLNDLWNRLAPLM